MNIKSISTHYALENIKIQKSLYESCPSVLMRAYVGNLKKVLLKNQAIQEMKTIGYSDKEADKFFNNYVLKYLEKTNSDYMLDANCEGTFHSIEDLEKTRQILLDRHNLAIRMMS